MLSLDFLENVEAFADLDDDQLTTIQGCCEVADYKRGEKIFAAGDTSEYFWMVREGQINLTWDGSEGPTLPESTITTLTEGMSFGWSGMVPPFKYRLSAHCASRSCKVIRIQRDRLNRLFAADARIGYKIMSKVMIVAGQRFHQLQDEVAKRRGHDIINRW
ncbi:MAG: cyclic nucleotide-binding domain-containing protein [Desulfobacterales bacterium]|jgi:signal-transduction protein with cAMP-binding, CBS, and nucleotidyltransferase domain